MDKHKRKNPRKKHRDSSRKDYKKKFVEEAKEEVIVEEDKEVVKNFIDNTMNNEMNTTEDEIGEKNDLDNNTNSFDIQKYVKLKKNNKTLLAIAILLGGIAGGSFFIDIAQLFSHRGFSARALQDAQVVEYDGNTWVRYDDPKITVDVFDADDCKDCVTDEVLVRLRSLIPTLEAHRIDVRTAEGKQLAKNNNIKYIPAFVFSDDIVNSDFYQNAAILFKEAPNNTYYFEATDVGVPVGEYLENPSTDTGINLGNADAKVTIVAYTDFTCKMCKAVSLVINKVKSEFKDDVRVIIKAIPNPEQKNAKKIAVAAQCAYEQGKFDEYVGTLFNQQATLIKSEKVTELLSRYATNLKLDKEQFANCLVNEDNQKKLDENQQEASQFAVIGTPTLFINGQPHVGVITYENLKDQIETILNPEEKTQE